MGEDFLLFSHFASIINSYLKTIVALIVQAMKIRKGRELIGHVICIYEQKTSNQSPLIWSSTQLKVSLKFSASECDNK